MQEFYWNNDKANANKDIHLLKAWQTYVNSIKGLLQDKKWYSKVTEGQNEWKEWL